MQIDNNNLEFRMSKRLDSDLSSHELADLDRLLDRDEYLAADMHQFEVLEDELGKLGEEDFPFDEADFRRQRQGILAEVDRKMLARKPKILKLFTKPVMTVVAIAAAVTVAVGAYFMVANATLTPAVDEKEIVDRKEIGPPVPPVVPQGEIVASISNAPKYAEPEKVVVASTVTRLVEPIMQDDQVKKDRGAVIVVFSPHKNPADAKNSKPKIKIGPMGYWPAG